MLLLSVYGDNARVLTQQCFICPCDRDRSNFNDEVYNVIIAYVCVVKKNEIYFSRLLSRVYVQ